MDTEGIRLAGPNIRNMAMPNRRRIALQGNDGMRRERGRRIKKQQFYLFRMLRKKGEMRASGAGYGAQRNGGTANAIDPVYRHNTLRGSWRVTPLLRVGSA